jgi:hypothetical protein
VADVVTGRLTFTANVTYSRHIDTSDGNYFAVVCALELPAFCAAKNPIAKTSINNISFFI